MVLGFALAICAMPGEGEGQLRSRSSGFCTALFTPQGPVCPARTARILVHKRKQQLFQASYERGKASESQRVYVEGPIRNPGNRMSLSQTEQQHLKARRIAPKSVVTVMDGANCIALAETSEDNTCVTILHLQSECSAIVDIGFSLAVCFGTPKSSSRANWAVEKLTEVGVDEIILARTERSVVREPPSDAKVGRWSRLTVAAAKQSLRSSIPKLQSIRGIDDIIAMLSQYRHKIVLSPNGAPLLAILDELSDIIESSVLVIAGPEGGLSSDEEKLLENSGCVLASLGNRRFRIETAVVTACAAVRFAVDRICMR